MNWLEAFKNWYQQHQTKAPYILIDDRERKSGFIDYLEQQGIPIKIGQLLVGDVAVSADTVIEIKRIKKKNPYEKLHNKDPNDLRESLFDSRLYDQAQDRKDVYLRSFTIIEWEVGANPFDDYFTKDHWDSLMISLWLQFNSMVIITNTFEETTKIICEIWRKDIEGEHYISPCNKEPKPKTLEARQKYFLSGLDDTGDKATQELLDTFDTPLRVLDWIMSTKVEYTASGNPKRPTNAPPGYGAKFIIKNQTILQSNKQDRIKDAAKIKKMKPNESRTDQL
jgi:ERCC4-type nuclease